MTVQTAIALPNPALGQEPVKAEGIGFFFFVPLRSGCFAVDRWASRNGTAEEDIPDLSDVDLAEQTVR